MREHLHAAAMRYQRLKKAKRVLAPHVRHRIARHNLLAVRHDEHIDVDERRPTRVRGKGAHK